MNFPTPSPAPAPIRTTISDNAPSGPSGVTAARIRAGLRIAATYAANRGGAYLLAFERLEAEAARLSAAESALDRARRVAGGLAA